MSKVILTPQGKIIRNIESGSKCLVEGLELCLNKLSKFRDQDDIIDYLEFGSSDFNLREEIARLILIATTLPNNCSPSVDIANTLTDGSVVDINSMFLQEYLEMEKRNKKNSFMKSDFYKSISNMVDEMDFKYSVSNNYSLNDCLVLVKNIRNLYISNLNNKKLDTRFREPLLELFQHNLDFSLQRMKNGVIDDVQVQTRYQ